MANTNHPITERMTNMDFSFALRVIKAGGKVSRSGWNGKGMWLALHKENGIFVREYCKTKVEYADYIAMKTADNILVPWVASQTDLLASDWGVVE